MASLGRRRPLEEPGFLKSEPKFPNFSVAEGSFGLLAACRDNSRCNVHLNTKDEIASECEILK